MCVRVQAPTGSTRHVTEGAKNAVVLIGNVAAEVIGTGKTLAATRRIQSTHVPLPVRTLHMVREGSYRSEHGAAIDTDDAVDRRAADRPADRCRRVRRAGPTRWAQCRHRGGRRRCTKEANAAAATTAAASVDDRIATPAAAAEAVASVAAVAAHQRGVCPARYASKTPSGPSANAQSRGLAAPTGHAIHRAAAACSSLRKTGASPTAPQRHCHRQEIHIVRAHTRARPRSRPRPRHRSGLMCGHGATVLVGPLRS